MAYLNKKSGFNAMLHVGYAMNGENSDTRYQSGSLLHFDRIGYVVIASSMISMIAMYFVQKPIARRAGRRVV